MWNAPLCLGVNKQFGISVPEQIRLFRKIGFDGFFTDWEQGADIAGYRAVADETGMLYQSIHAPFHYARAMWEAGAAGRAGADDLICCLKDCHENGVPLMIMHTYIGFDEVGTPTTEGFENYGRVADAAGQLGVKIALENTEGEPCLDALLQRFADRPYVGFCWDTGHELCYNHGRDLMADYGNRLFGTHLNDNLGISALDGHTYWTDDLHLLPFDGIADWDSIVDRLNACSFSGPLTFEMNTESKPGRLENAAYARLPLEEYLTDVYKRACRVAALKARRK